MQIFLNFFTVIYRFWTRVTIVQNLHKFKQDLQLNQKKKIFLRQCNFRISWVIVEYFCKKLKPICKM